MRWRTTVSGISGIVGCVLCGQAHPRLTSSAREFLAGKTPTLADHPELDYAKAVSVGGVLPAGADWRTLAEAA